MKAIIVDDEPKAIELLKSYIQHFANIELVQTFRNGLKAFEFLSKTEVDIVFLDINMPHISGISLSKIISEKTHVIFTTAYAEYAVESYEVNAVDYLLKPISLERFTNAIKKLMVENKPATHHDRSNLAIKSGTTVHFVKPENILYLEKDGNYMNYYMVDNKKVIARESINEALAILPAYFIQIHRSFIVNTKNVSSVKQDSLMIDQKEISVGASYKEQLSKSLNL